MRFRFEVQLSAGSSDDQFCGALISAVVLVAVAAKVPTADLKQQRDSQSIGDSLSILGEL